MTKKEADEKVKVLAAKMTELQAQIKDAKKINASNLKQLQDEHEAVHREYLPALKVHLGLPGYKAK